MSDLNKQVAGNLSPDKLVAPASALRDTGLHEQITAIVDASSDEAQDSSATHTYPVDKLQAHLQNICHVAISIFVFSNSKLLLQQRAETKYHSGGLWANTVCSHPRWQETVASCAERRLQEELGWTTPLNAGEQIDYSAQVGELYENEKVHCFYGALHSKDGNGCDIETLATLCNPGEVSSLRWMSLEEIDRELEQSPETFSAWFRIYMSVHRDKLQRMMDAASHMQPVMQA